MIVRNGYLIAAEATDERYSEELVAISARPSAPDGFEAKLRADTLEWELVPAPPDPDPGERELSSDEALNIILGGTSYER